MLLVPEVSRDPENPSLCFAVARFRARFFVRSFCFFVLFFFFLAVALWALSAFLSLWKAERLLKVSPLFFLGCSSLLGVLLLFQGSNLGLSLLKSAPSGLGLRSPLFRFFRGVWLKSPSSFSFLRGPWLKSPSPFAFSLLAAPFLACRVLAGLRFQAKLGKLPRYVA